MVIVILSVTSMMVVPSFFSSSASLDDEAHRLVQTLRLAQDEAVLSGQMLRISLRAHGYSFEAVSAKNKWQPFSQSPYQDYKLAEGVRIEDVSPQPLLEQAQTDDVEPIIAHLLFPPEGMIDIADITLIQTEDVQTSELTTRRIQFRPGPGGIRMLKENTTGLE